MKNKIVALVVFGGILGGWFWYDYKNAPQVHELVPVSETGLLDATSRLMSATTTSNTFTLLNTENEYEYSIVVKDSLGQLVQILGPLDLSDVVLSQVDVVPESFDANFDGYDDIRIQTCQGATGNACYTYWTFSPFDGNYHEDQELSVASGASVVFDSGDKIIFSHWKGGCAGLCFNESLFSLETGRPVLIRQVTQDRKNFGDSDSGIFFVKITKELKDGVMATTSVEEFRDEQ